MSCSTCGRGSLWADLSKAAAKLTAARLRGVGALSTHPQWNERAAICEFCPVRVLKNGKTYCGKPLLTQIAREATDGCGCPITPKAKDPREHCPVDPRHQPAIRIGETCTCKWCSHARSRHGSNQYAVAS